MTSDQISQHFSIVAQQSLLIDTALTKTTAALQLAGEKEETRMVLLERKQDLVTILTRMDAQLDEIRRLHPIIITETDLPAAIAEIQYQPVHAPGVVEVNVE